MAVEGLPGILLQGVRVLRQELGGRRLQEQQQPREGRGREVQSAGSPESVSAIFGGVKARERVAEYGSDESTVSQK